MPFAKKNRQQSVLHLIGSAFYHIPLSPLHIRPVGCRVVTLLGGVRVLSIRKHIGSSHKQPEGNRKPIYYCASNKPPLTLNRYHRCPHGYERSNILSRASSIVRIGLHHYQSCFAQAPSVKGMLFTRTSKASRIEDYISYFYSHFLQKVRFDVNNGGDVTTNLSKKR